MPFNVCRYRFVRRISNRATKDCIIPKHRPEFLKLKISQPVSLKYPSRLGKYGVLSQVLSLSLSLLGRLAGAGVEVGFLCR